MILERNNALDNAKSRLCDSRAVLLFTGAQTQQRGPVEGDFFTGCRLFRADGGLPLS